MRALELVEQRSDVKEAIRGLRVVEKSVPRPGRGQVLVRIEAAPCNPSDLLFLQGLYGVTKTLPTTPGWEGAGTVVASGGGLLGRWLTGKRVSCGGQSDADGTWAEYYIAETGACAPLHRDVDFDRGATMLINPMTAVGLMDVAARGRHRALIQTGAASQVGRMLVRLASDAGLPLVNVVRRPAQVEILRSLGAEHVLDSSDGNFDGSLERICTDLGVTMAIEAVAGEMTGKLLDVMPRGSVAVVYGALSEEDCSGIDPIGLIFAAKRVDGFYLGDWIRERGYLGTLRALSRVQRLIREGAIETAVQLRVGLDGASDALLQYVGRMTDGKVLIKP
jgi:NADPH:quinone reductase-like Zn-dependent oxidoreductase